MVYLYRTDAGLIITFDTNLLFGIFIYYDVVDSSHYQHFNQSNSNEIYTINLMVHSIRLIQYNPNVAIIVFEIRMEEKIQYWS